MESEPVPVEIMDGKHSNPIMNWFIVFVFFCILTVLTLVTVIYAKEAEQEAREVRQELKQLNVTAQNRCMVQVVLSYPPPVQEDQFAEVLADFDTCIAEQTGATDE